MARTIAIANQKGGVGKTTSTANLSAALAEQKHRVLLVDLDPQGALAVSVGVNPYALDHTIYDVMLNPKIDVAQVVLHPKPSLDLLPANIDLSGAEVELLNEIGRESILKEKLAPLQKQYDFILLDCPPSLGLLTINGLTAAGEVLIPTQCQYFALRGMQLLFRTIEKVTARSNPALRLLGLLPTMYDARTSHAKEVLEELQRLYGAQVFPTPIKVRVALADAAVGGQTILEFDPTSEVAAAYRDAAQEVLRRAK
jgi:chromosome partitioning protein